MVKGKQNEPARELRWMGIILRRIRTMPREDKREIQERLNMWDNLIEQDPKMKKMRAESRAKGLVEGLQSAIVTAVRVRFPHLTELAQQKVTRINKPDALNLLLEQVTAAPDEASARLLLEMVAA